MTVLVCPARVGVPLGQRVEFEESVSCLGWYAQHCPGLRCQRQPESDPDCQCRVVGREAGLDLER